MVIGVKSKKFGCFWVSMFLVALCYPENPTSSDKKRYTLFYHSLLSVLPCKFCREFSRDVLLPKFPLNLNSRLNLMYSLYIWKDQVNKKLGQTSPSFESVLKKYSKNYAKCVKSKQKCI